MAQQKFANNASAKLAASISSVDVSLSVVSGQGAIFPTLSGSDWFTATLVSADGSIVEIVKVTARATDAFTIVRAFEDGARLPAAVFAAGDFVKGFVTAQALTDIEAFTHDAELVALAGLTSAANKGIQFTGSGAAATYDLTTAGKALLDDADAAAQRTTLGLGTAAALDSDTDVTLAANSDTRLATQKAIKAYIASVITGGASDVMIFKGVIDCSASPNYPAADAGNLYKVSVAGKIGGASGPNVEIGDTLYCITDSTASGTQAGVGANWVIVQENIDGAVVGPASVTDSRIALFDGTTGKLIKDGGKLLTDLIANTLLTTLGDIIYASAANTPARLAGNTTTTRKWLRSTGAAGVATAPAYDVIVENDVGASTQDAGNTSTAITVDWSLARTTKVTATGNFTLTHSNMVAGLVYTLEVYTGAGSFTGAFASTNFAGGTAPTVTVAASKVDVFTFYKTIGGTIFGAIFGQSFAP